MARTTKTAKKVPPPVRRSKRVKKIKQSGTTNDTMDGYQNRCAGPHPLLIPMVINIIIDFTIPDLQFLKQLRLVCSSWYEASLHLWRRKSAVLTIIPDIPVLAFALPETEFKGIQFSSFLQEYQDPLSFYRFSQRPFSKYRLTNFTIDMNVCNGYGPSQNQQAKLFWDFIGPLMEYVHFEKCTFLETVHQPMHQVLIQKMSNLRELALTKVELKGYPGTGNTAIGFGEIYHPTLKYLTVYQDINMNFANLLELPLKSVVINLMLFRRPSSTYHAINTLEIATLNSSKFFKSVCSCLETLEIFLPPLYLQNSPISFNTETIMSCLRELHLFGPVFEKFDFLRFTPVLEKLCINMGCFEKREEIRKMGKDDPALFRHKTWILDLTKNVSLEMENFQMETLSHFEIDYEFKDIKLRLLGRWMPRLRILKTVLSEKTIGVVCEVWGDSLVELGCGFGSKVNNKMFISEEYRHTKSKDKKNISDLQKLERFQFDKYCGEQSKLTDDAVFKGLLKMASLKFVQICVGRKMSLKAEEALKNATENCCFIRNYLEKEVVVNDKEYECCERSLFFGEAE